MRATRLNHVSIPAVDVQATAAFYCDVFGMERLPSPNFGLAVQWLRLGEFTLHVYEVAEQAPRSYQHFAVEVDDFEACYRRVLELDAFEHGSRFRYLWELPDGTVQLYLRDPSDNFVEVDWPDVGALDRSVFGDDLKLLSDEFPQSAENLRASLFLRLRQPA